MKNLLLLFTALIFSNTIFAQANIEEARTYAEGATLTITGVVTNGSTLGPIRYLQDATAGLPVYDPDITNNWNPGDEITVTGTMGDFNDLIQIGSVTMHTVNSSGNALPTPHTVTPNGLNGDIEAELATVENITFDDAGGVFTYGTHGFADANGESGVIFIRGDHPFIDMPIPVNPVNLTGIVSIYQGTYQLLPRDLDDFEVLGAFTITQLPEQSDITQTGFTLTWGTDIPVNHTIRYGPVSYTHLTLPTTPYV